MKNKVLDIKKQIETLKQMFEFINYDELEDIDDFYLEMFNYYLATTSSSLLPLKMFFNICLCIS